MKNWKQAKLGYTKSHLLKSLAQPERRLKALTMIENTFKDKFPELLKDENIFQNIGKQYFFKLYACMKGKSLSGAEKSVITGLYNFSQ